MSDKEGIIRMMFAALTCTTGLALAQANAPRGTWPLAILCYFCHWWGPTERRTATDWTRFDAMTDEEVRKAALSDTDAQPLSRRQLAKMRRASPVKRLRWKLGLSQTEFAERFHIPVGTVRDWEQHRHEPDQAALSYLKVIEADADFVARAVA